MKLFQLMRHINLVKKISPDIIISPFDREESISIALVGIYLRIPIAHLGAGDKTEYNLDGIIRHSVTKLSNFSLCFTKQNSERVKKMGEEKSRVFTVGHTAVERYKKANKISLSNLSKFLRLDLKKENHMILFIQHPVSNWLDKTKEHIKTSFRAIDELKIKPAALLIDGNRFNPYYNIQHHCIIKGDSKFLSIAAASVIAKTFRDDIMQSIGEDFPNYNWDKNKGYPTKNHRAAIAKYGVTSHHRKSFTLLKKEAK